MELDLHRIIEYDNSLASYAKHSALELDLLSSGNNIGFTACKKLIAFIDENIGVSDQRGKKKTDLFFDSSTVLAIDQALSVSGVHSSELIQDVVDRSRKLLKSLQDIINNPNFEADESIDEIIDFCLNLSEHFTRADSYLENTVEIKIPKV